MTQMPSPMVGPRPWRLVCVLIGFPSAWEAEVSVCAKASSEGILQHQSDLLFGGGVLVKAVIR